MKAKEYLQFLTENMHTVVMATTDDRGLPVTCAMDIMDYDDSGLYFLTAKGKSLYKRLKNSGFVALTAVKGKDTTTSVSLSIRGKAEELGFGKIPTLFQKNPYMYQIYPNEESMHALTAFRIFDGSGEWFDLSKTPIERETFTFGGAENKDNGYYITESCIGCGKCQSVCPQSCIDIIERKAIIRENNCLHCGNCAEICPADAVIERKDS